MRQISVPIGRRRRCSYTRHLLYGARQAGVVEGRADEIRPRRILEQSNAAADDGARTANGAKEGRNLGGRAIRPGEADSRTEIQSVGKAIVAQSEQRIERGIEAGTLEKL